MNRFRVSSVEFRVGRGASCIVPQLKTQNSKHVTCQSALATQRGMALMVVLWILAFLSVVFTTFMFSMRTELAAASNFREETAAYYLAEAGVYRAAAEIMNADRNVPPDSSLYDSLEERWHTNPGAYEGVSLGRGHYWVTVSDEESKIPLNGATDALLRRLLSNSGLRDERLLSVIVDSIQDWRDADTLHRLNGAEDGYYLSLPVPYKPKNGNFETIDELLLIKGMTPEILYGNAGSGERRAALEGQLPWERELQAGEYRGIARHLSILSVGRVNVNTAPAEVLLALGLTPVEAALAIERRIAAPFRTVAELTGLLTSVAGGGRQGFAVVPEGQPGPAETGNILATLNQIGTVTSRHFTVESVGQVTGSRLTARIAAVLQNWGTPGRSQFSIRLWNVDPRQGA